MLLGRLYESLVCRRIIAHLRSLFSSNGSFCAIWYQLHNLKKVKNTYEAVLLLVKLQALTHNFTKSNIRSWVFSSFLNFYKWYQIAQSIVYKNHLFDWSANQLSDFYVIRKLVSFHTPWKHQNISGFLMFSGGIELRLAAWNGLIYDVIDAVHSFRLTHF